MSLRICTEFKKEFGMFENMHKEFKKEFGMFENMHKEFKKEFGIIFHIP
jgi:hypothetical protein